MERYDYTVEKNESGTRIDRYLAEKDSGFSRSFIQKLLKDGQVTVGGSLLNPTIKSGKMTASIWKFRIPVSRILFRKIFRWIFFMRTRMC